MVDVEPVRENLPIYGSLFVTLTVAILTVAASQFVPLPVILAGAAVVGVVGCFVFDKQLVENLVAVTVSVLLAGVLAQWSILYPWILAVPGLIVGYVWGGVVADQLDKANVARMRDQSMEPEKE